MKRRFRLRRQSDFRSVIEGKRVYSSRSLVAFAVEGATPVSRVGVTVSRNITPDPEHGIGNWSDAQIKRAITVGIRPDGTLLSRTMASHWYAKIAPSDLDAIVAYLRSLPPVKTP